MGLADKLRLFLEGSTLDVDRRFELIRKAISGTMSKFYMARDRQTDEIFGLKICDKQKTDYFESRFAGLNKPTEGAIARQFDHPLIVKTFKYGKTTNDQDYILMEYLEGSGLNTLIVQQSQKLNGIRARLIQQIAEALQAVHEAGFIHRDVCPRNFIASTDAKSIKLIDFGLTVPTLPPYMRPGNRTGTPNYMAPEIVRRRKTDKRLDIFAFGVTAFQLLTFELPWPGADVTGKAAMVHDTLPPLDIFKHRPDLNRQLGESVMACLSVSPEQRPDSFKSFRSMIGGVFDEQEP